ncbi:hypothetical protein GCM10027040_05120 [Halomonas shantousis]
MTKQTSLQTNSHTLLNAEQFAAILGIAKSTFYRWLSEGHVPAGIKYGPNTTRWPRHVVEQWLAEKEAPTSSSEAQ